MIYYEIIFEGKQMLFIQKTANIIYNFSFSSEEKIIIFISHNANSNAVI